MANVRFRTVIPAVSAIVLITLCGGAGAATQLQWKLAKGKTYYQKAMIEQQITQTLMGQEQKIDQTIGIGHKLQVLDVDSQGNMRIQYTFLWSRLKQVNPMAQVDYDSSQKTPAPAGAEGFAALIGQSYTIKMTPQGKILDVNGVEQLRDAVLKKLPPGTDATVGMNPVAGYIDKESLKQMTEASTAIYPDKPVNPGDSWSKDTTMVVGFKTIIQSKWTLQKEQNGVATISVASTMRTDSSGPAMETQGMKMRFALSGPQEGTVQVAEATGVITSGKARTQLKGDIQVGQAGAAADAPPMMTIPMVVDTQTTSEMSEQMWKTTP